MAVFAGLGLDTSLRVNVDRRRSRRSAGLGAKSTARLLRPPAGSTVNADSRHSRHTQTRPRQKAHRLTLALKHSPGTPQPGSADAALAIMGAAADSILLVCPRFLCARYRCAVFVPSRWLGWGFSDQAQPRGTALERRKGAPDDAMAPPCLLAAVPRTWTGPQRSPADTVPEGITLRKTLRITL